MQKEDKVNIFKTELGFILSDEIRKFAEFALGELPDYFFVIPASSTGKYHPKYALGEGGLTRHTKAAVRMALTLFNLEMYSNFYDQQTRDCIITALILHDGLKSGIEKQSYTVNEHPNLACKYIEDSVVEAIKNDTYDGVDSFLIRESVYMMIRSHMGQWNLDKSGKAIMPKPATPVEKFVHMCDYLASRKFIEVNFEASI